MKRHVTGINSTANPVATGYKENLQVRIEKDTPMANMPHILGYSVTDYSYNEEKSCGIVAITVGRSTSCMTFIPLTVKGSLAESEIFVGVCQKADCVHNSTLEYTAVAVSVGAGTTDYLSFEAR